ncbi:MAG TPA: NUDIX hydrolase [Solirubrobacterales bacterium]|nr:NUDIX hydrolase [Solirubrobacterales bacterium]
MARDLDPELWETIQASVPIFCVDVLPIRPAVGTEARDGGIELGLILRNTPDQGSRWCTIGGRLELDESIEAAVSRELAAAVGDGLEPIAGLADPEPLIVEYGRRPAPGAAYDLRKHAVSLTHPRWLDGEPSVRGEEAEAFRWWRLPDLDGSVMGFGQESLLPRIAEAVGAASGVRAR